MTQSWSALKQHTIVVHFLVGFGAPISSIITISSIADNQNYVISTSDNIKFARLEHALENMAAGNAIVLQQSFSLAL